MRYLYCPRTLRNPLFRRKRKQGNTPVENYVPVYPLGINLSVLISLTWNFLYSFATVPISPPSFAKLDKTGTGPQTFHFSFHGERERDTRQKFFFFFLLSRSISTSRTSTTSRGIFLHRKIGLREGQLSTTLDVSFIVESHRSNFRDRGNERNRTEFHLRTFSFRELPIPVIQFPEKIPHRSSSTVCATNRSTESYFGRINITKSPLE